MLFPRPRRPLLFPFGFLIWISFFAANPLGADIQIVDSITGQAIAPSHVTLTPSGREGADSSPSRGDSLRIHSPNHQPLSVVIPHRDTNAYPIRVRVPPLTPPAEVQPATIERDLRPDAHLILGYVVDDETAQPLADVMVGSFPSGIMTHTDHRGFFKLQIPLAGLDSAPAKAPGLICQKDGFTTIERRYLQLWPYGDWTYRIRLRRGRGTVAIDERSTRRHALPSPPQLSPEMQPFIPSDTDARFPDGGGGGSPNGSSVRVPTMIRVLYNNVVYYETMEEYVRHSLPSEWIASWGSYTGGINSLKAGAVAIRTYAIGFVNSPSASTYDICATTSCQVYNPDFTDIRTTTAVDQTPHYVMVSSSGNITRGLTEYSAENNSLGFSCGDGFTAPSGGCLSDPICAGETRFGHGRGMCQWGTVRWATALTFPNRSSSGNMATGFPRQDWIWILEHYYPNLRLVQGAPLAVGDVVKVIGSSSISVRRCSDGGIADGANCLWVGSKTVGATGTVIAGPAHVVVDGLGYTWWKMQWSDGLVGWAAENWLDRVVPSPPAPTDLTATAVSTNDIVLSWDYSTNTASGFSIEQAPTGNGPWTEIAMVSAETRSYSVRNLAAGVTYHFRVRAFNLSFQSDYSNLAHATTAEPRLILLPIGNRTVTELSPVTLTAIAVAPERVQPLTDFESFANAANGTVLFRVPTLSGTTDEFLDPTPNASVVTETFPAGHGTGRVLRINFNFNATTNAWLRLTTSAAAQFPNPVIDLGAWLRFDLHSSREVGLGVGVRETTVDAGTPAGSNGGTTGPIEWSGVPSKVGSQPRPSRTIPANTWTNLQFALATEPATSFSGGDGVIATQSGLAVLEHLAIVPTSGTGVHDIFLDNFMVVRPRRVTFALGTNAPTGATINLTSGLFSWTPTEPQAPSIHTITVRVTDDSIPQQTNETSFTITVNELNLPPELAAVSDRIVHAGTTVTVTNAATDLDLPPNALTFSLLSGPPTAELNPSTGVFRWQPLSASVGTTNRIIVGVQDDGSPVGSDLQAFHIIVQPTPFLDIATVAEGMVNLRWSVIPGQGYQVQFKTDLNQQGWNDLGPVRTADVTQIEVIEPVSGGQRFYRLLVVE